MSEKQMWQIAHIKVSIELQALDLGQHIECGGEKHVLGALNSC